MYILCTTQIANIRSDWMASCSPRSFTVCLLVIFQQRHDAVVFKSIRARAIDIRVNVPARAARGTNERNLKETRKQGNTRTRMAFHENTRREMAFRRFFLRMR